MTIAQGNKLLWSDIQNIYTQLNNCQTKFGITKSAIPTNPGAVKPTVVSNLKSLIVALDSSKYVSASDISAVNNLTVPTAGTLIKPAPFTTMTSTLNTVYNNCANDSNFGDNSNFGNFGDRSNDGDNSDWNNNTCFGPSCTDNGNWSYC